MIPATWCPLNWCHVPVNNPDLKSIKIKRIHGLYIHFSQLTRDWSESLKGLRRGERVVLYLDGHATTWRMTNIPGRSRGLALQATPGPCEKRWLYRKQFTLSHSPPHATGAAVIARAGRTDKESRGCGKDYDQIMAETEKKWDLPPQRSTPPPWLHQDRKFQGLSPTAADTDQAAYAYFWAKQRRQEQCDPRIAVRPRAAKRG